jgi:hypothetical protein
LFKEALLLLVHKESTLHLSSLEMLAVGLLAVELLVLVSRAA